MAIKDKKYDKLTLNDQSITDPLLLALAWKKAHDYVRTTNWYADNFELDISSIDLANRCNEWANDIKTGVTFTPLNLVPAPKSHPWTFDNQTITGDQILEGLSWHPTPKNKNIKLAPLSLRPLAHAEIREQTIMTLVMMCLADEVETKQGDPATDYAEVHEKGVVSYGNRLYCRYEGGSAEHSYGATTTYSKYFTDYRKFLERPYYFAKKELTEKSEDDEIYLVELDLSKFFDCIKRPLLIKKIKALTSYQATKTNRNPSNNILRAFASWEWSAEAGKTYQKLLKSKNRPAVPNGLPQGLVASGFLSNIYMAEFDASIRKLMGQLLNENDGIRLVDYCRYVDDMRFVISGPSRNALIRRDGASTADTSHLSNVCRSLLATVQPLLNDLNLEVNEEKTKVEVFRGKSVGISRTLEDIQSSVSGPISYDDAEIHLGQLESLLALSPTSEADQPDDHSGSFNHLAAIEKDMFDVREDTLKRFAANKISRLLNNIRHFTSRETDEAGNPAPGDWDYLQERHARRFIACWSRDPALVMLLKKGLELFPSTKLLEPVLTELDKIIQLPSEEISKEQRQLAETMAAIGKYTLAEIYRHAATTIHRKDSQAVPAHAETEHFFEVLQAHALEKLNHSSEHQFDFLAEQARFLLLVRRDTTLEGVSGNHLHDLIFKIVKGFRAITLPRDISDRDIAASILIANQLIQDRKPVLRSSSNILEKIRGTKRQQQILELIAIQEPALFRMLVLHARPLKYSWPKKPPVKNLIARLYIDTKPSTRKLSEIKRKIPLFKLIARPDNPFANEIMSLKLMLAILDQAPQFRRAKDNDVIDLAMSEVTFGELSATPKYSVFDSSLTVDPLKFHSILPSAANHLHKNSDDVFVLQRAALCLRATLSGTADPTGFGTSIKAKIGYRGLKSTQFKRQLGLLTTPEALAGDTAQFSGWLTTLLSKLLRWPGVRVNDHGYDWPHEFTIENVRALITKRLAKLKNFYCQRSEMPSLPELVSPDWKAAKNSLIVAMVQTKMPQQQDFATHGLLLDSPEYRAKHRCHVARVAKLVIKHIEAQHIEKPSNGEREQDIDLIVLPELAVHQDDMDILVHLSRKTHAIIIAGLGFLEQPGIKGPNNCAVWIVPRKHNGNRNEIHRLQGKHHMTASEKKLKIAPWRPYQLMLELAHPAYPNKQGFVLTSAICFDATDIALSADLRDRSNALVIPALNRDVNTFDSMVEALHYHMYQHVVLVNTGEFGGSYAMAPYDKRHERLIAHSSGNDQVAINTFRMNMFDFRRDGVGVSMQSEMVQKTAPAGIKLP